MLGVLIILTMSVHVSNDRTGCLFLQDTTELAENKDNEEVAVKKEVEEVAKRVDDVAGEPVGDAVVREEQGDEQEMVAEDAVVPLADTFDETPASAEAGEGTDNQSDCIYSNPYISSCYTLLK